MLGASKFILTAIKMNSDSVQRLEANAAKAEKLIDVLKRQIAQLKIAGSVSSEADALRTENKALKREIVEWKGRLCAAEVANGKVQIDGVMKPSKEEAVKGKAPPPPSKGEAVRAEEAPPRSSKMEKRKKMPAPAEEGSVDVGRLDMRVGLIRSAKRHPDADSLYVEEVDVGEAAPRTVISGLVKFVPEQEMQNRMAVLMCNLKPAKMRGILSEAMVMCASTPDKVEILLPPVGARPGDPVHVEGFERRPDAQLNPKKKVFETCAPDLKVDAKGVATYKGVPWTVGGKHCVAKTLRDVQIK